MYEKAVTYFERAAQIQPQEVKWKLMVASCHRHSGDYALAFEIYRAIHADFPDNIECLRYVRSAPDSNPPLLLAPPSFQPRLLSSPFEAAALEPPPGSSGSASRLHTAC